LPIAGHWQFPFPRAPKQAKRSKNRLTPFRRHSKPGIQRMGASITFGPRVQRFSNGQPPRGNNAKAKPSRPPKGLSCARGIQIGLPNFEPSPQGSQARPLFILSNQRQDSQASHHWGGPPNLGWILSPTPRGPNKQNPLFRRCFPLSCAPWNSSKYGSLLTQEATQRPQYLRANCARYPPHNGVHPTGPAAKVLLHKTRAMHTDSIFTRGLQLY